MKYKAIERVTEYVNGLEALQAEYAMICTGPIPKINCKSGDVILFTENVAAKILHHDGIYICARPGDITAELGFITWNAYSYTFKPFSDKPPVKCSYMQDKLKILACATGFIRTL